MKLVGISGTNGAGKDSLGQILVDDFGWLFVSVTDILRDELKKRDLPIERKQLAALSAKWRRQYGRGVLVDKALAKFDPKKHRGLAIASLRNLGEVDEVHKLGGQVVWIDADLKVRYQRIYSRARGAEDQKTFEQFLKEEQAEMNHSGDHHTLSLEDVKERADIFITNGGSTEEFKKKIVNEMRL